MKSVLVFAVLAFALSFCGVVNRLTSQFSPASQQNGNAAASNNSSATKGAGEKNVEYDKPQPTAAQQAIIDGSKEFKWDEQGITWKLPASYRKLSQDRNRYSFMGADTASLHFTISPMAEDFPVDASIKAYYDGQVSNMKNGEVETVRYLEIDGVRGVEFTEAKKDSNDDHRRHHWIAYRKYAGQTQMLNFILATANGKAFEKRLDEFKAILYSTELVNQ